MVETAIQKHFPGGGVDVTIAAVHNRFKALATIGVLPPYANLVPAIIDLYRGVIHCLHSLPALCGPLESLRAFLHTLRFIEFTLGFQQVRQVKQGFRLFRVKV